MIPVVLSLAMLFLSLAIIYVGRQERRANEAFMQECVKLTREVDELRRQLREAERDRTIATLCSLK